jgi:hypothetical protein
VIHHSYWVALVMQEKVRIGIGIGTALIVDDRRACHSATGWWQGLGGLVSGHCTAGGS